MLFVNQIGKILHEDVHEVGSRFALASALTWRGLQPLPLSQMLGTANKNIGDAFLFVWKLPSLCEPGKRACAALSDSPVLIASFPRAPAAKCRRTRVYCVCCVYCVCAVGQADNFPMADYAVRAFLK